jgi:uncharacterized protein
LQHEVADAIATQHHGTLMHRLAPFAIQLILLLTATAGFTASFDCSPARTQVEKLICADSLLGRLDDTLHRVVYKRIRE